MHSLFSFPSFQHFLSNSYFLPVTNPAGIAQPRVLLTRCVVGKVQCLGLSEALP